MIKISLKEIVEKNPELEVLNYNPSVMIKQFNHDSRDIAEGEFFLPVVGDKFDGHDYIAEALNKGGAAAICQRDRLNKIKGVEKPVIVVETVEQGLVLLANVVRDKIDVPVAGITGSVGKSTTRRMLTSILSERGRVLSTDKSNTLWGNIRLMASYSDEDFVVLELAVDRLEEMKFHCLGSLPDIGAMLNIGKVHAGPLGGVDKIFETKRELADYCARNKKIIVLNIDDSKLNELSTEIPDEVLVSVGKDAGNDVFFADVNLSQSGTDFRLNIFGEWVDIQTGLFGKAYVYNAMVSCAIAYKLGLTRDEMRVGLGNVKGVPGRFEVKHIRNDFIIVNDAYNANPISMKMSIETFDEMFGGSDSQKILFLGEMKELGEVAGEEHKKLGEFLKKFDFDNIYYIGDYADEVGVKRLKDWQEARDIVEKLRKKDNGVRILLKGSNSIGLYNIVV